MNAVSGSNRVHETISIQQARQEIKDGLEAKARLEQINGLKTQIAEHEENAKKLNAGIAKIQTGNESRAARLAALAAKKAALLEKK